MGFPDPGCRPATTPVLGSWAVASAVRFVCNCNVGFPTEPNSILCVSISCLRYQRQDRPASGETVAQGTAPGVAALERHTPPTALAQGRCPGSAARLLGSLTHGRHQPPPSWISRRAILSNRSGQRCQHQCQRMPSVAVTAVQEKDKDEFPRSRSGFDRRSCSSCPCVATLALKRSNTHPAVP